MFQQVDMVCVDGTEYPEFHDYETCTRLHYSPTYEGWCVSKLFKGGEVFYIITPESVVRILARHKVPRTPDELSVYEGRTVAAHVKGNKETMV